MILTISLRRVHAQNNHFVLNVETSGIEVRNIRLVYRITSIYMIEKSKMISENVPPNVIFRQFLIFQTFYINS